MGTLAIVSGRLSTLFLRRALHRFVDGCLWTSRPCPVPSRSFAASPAAEPLAKNSAQPRALYRGDVPGFLLLLTIGTGWVFRINYRNWALSVLALLTLAWGIHWAMDRQSTRITILPLKGGAAVFVDAPGQQQDLLVNCGNENSANSILKP